MESFEFTKTAEALIKEATGAGRIIRAVTNQTKKNMQNLRYAYKEGKNTQALAATHAIDNARGAKLLGKALKKERIAQRPNLSIAQRVRRRLDPEVANKGQLSHGSRAGIGIGPQSAREIGILETQSMLKKTKGYSGWSAERDGISRLMNS